jgi:hypothetical protein
LSSSPPLSGHRRRHHPSPSSLPSPPLMSSPSFGWLGVGEGNMIDPQCRGGEGAKWCILDLIVVVSVFSTSTWWRTHVLNLLPPSFACNFNLVAHSSNNLANRFYCWFCL